MKFGRLVDSMYAAHNVASIRGLQYVGIISFSNISAC